VIQNVENGVVWGSYGHSMSLEMRSIWSGQKCTIYGHQLSL